jgi:hypothetical protein
MNENKQRHSLVFDWFKQNELIPALNAKKTKIHEEFAKPMLELKILDDTMALLNVADEFCQFIRDQLFEKLNSLGPAYFAEDSDDDNDYEPQQSLLIYMLPVKTEMNIHTFEGQYAKLFNAYLQYLNYMQYGDLLEYTQKQFNLITEDVSKSFSNISQLRLRISKLSKEITPFQRYELEGIKVELLYYIGY